MPGILGEAPGQTNENALVRVGFVPLPRGGSCEMKPILSQRSSLRIERIWAVVRVDRDGKEGVLRRDTPFGTQPWITDDGTLIPKMLEMAQDMFPTAFLRIARFDRHPDA
jgi:hypothetical protein